MIRLAASKNPSMAPISAAVSGAVASLKKHFSSGKKVNLAAVERLTKVVKDVNAELTKEDAHTILLRLQKDLNELENEK